MPIDRNGGQYITANPQQPTQSSAPGIWDIDEQGSAQAAGRWPLPPNVVQRSLRFNSADSAYLSRTPAASNRRVWTFSCWLKRAKLSVPGTVYNILSTDYVSSNGHESRFDDNNSIKLADITSGSTAWVLQTNALYRDCSAWYHIVIAFDSPQGTPSERVKLYVNGTQVTSFATATYPSLNYESYINSTLTHYIGAWAFSGSPARFYDGYMAEINFVDGQALTPSSFGQTDAQTGQWIPRVYSGSYGTNGFRLQFLDNSGTTATTLGKDTSGMGNNWTPNNFSVAAGTGNDSLRDVPMNYYSPDNGLGGEVIGNYCTLNPLNAISIAPANGNLDVSNSTAGTASYSGGTIAMSSGKWYFEVLVGGNYANIQAGVRSSDGILSNTTMYRTFNAIDGTKNNGSSSTAYGSAAASGSIVGCAVDMDAGKIWFSVNNVWQASGNPTAGTNAAFTDLTGSVIPLFTTYVNSAGNTSTIVTNFGQRPFAYTAPSGFKALCTQNLPWSGTITTSGTFTGNASTDGPFVYLNGIPTAMTINGNAVTFGTQADKLSNGFKVRSSSASYNASGSNTYSVSTTGNQFSKANAQANP